MAIAVNDSNFNEIVINSDKPVVVDFWGPQCVPCMALKPLYHDMEKDESGRFPGKKWLKPAFHFISAF